MKIFYFCAIIHSGDVMRGKNQEENKKINKNLVLKLIITKGPISRIELSKKTSLTKMSITNIVNEFLQEGIIEEFGNSDTSMGRKPILLDVIPNCKLIIGVYISRNYIETFISDLKGTISSINRVRLTNENNDSLSKKIIESIDNVINQADKDKIIGIGISCIGPLDSKNCIILNPPNFYGICNLNIFELLNNRYNLPIHMDNDMNTAAMAEKYFGKAVDMANFIYVGVTNGVGAGIFANGALYKGNSGFSGELGHITVNAHGEKCSCGNIGCLEMYTSLPDNWNQANKTDLDEICKYLSVGLTTMVNLFDPECVFLGHDIALAEDAIRKTLSKELNRRMISAEYRSIEVEFSKFLDKSPIKGAVALVINNLISS